MLAAYCSVVLGLIALWLVRVAWKYRNTNADLRGMIACNHELMRIMADGLSGAIDAVNRKDADGLTEALSKCRQRVQGMTGAS